MNEDLKTINRECSVCFEDIDINKIVTTDCNHTFCNTCFFKWIRVNSNCPTCRKDFGISKKDNNIEEQRRILNDLYSRQRQITEFLRTGVVLYDKKERQLKLLEDKKRILQQTIHIQNIKIEEMNNEWIKKRRLIEVEQRMLEMDTEALRTSLTEEKKRVRKNYKKEWSILHSKHPLWKSFINNQY